MINLTIAGYFETSLSRMYPPCWQRMRPILPPSRLVPRHPSAVLKEACHRHWWFFVGPVSDDVESPLSHGRGGSSSYRPRFLCMCVMSSLNFLCFWASFDAPAISTCRSTLFCMSHFLCIGVIFCLQFSLFLSVHGRSFGLYL